MNLNADEKELLDLVDHGISSLADRSVPHVRRVRREISRRTRDWSGRRVVRFAETLLHQSDSCPRWFAYELINQHQAAMASLRAGTLMRLGKGIGSWGDVDAFACYLSGPALRGHQVSGELIHGWARSRDRWWRRAALVSTVALNSTSRGGSGDAARTLAVCDRLIGDRDDMVVKAMSWALRELITKCPGAVSDYVELHHETLHARVVREVTNKLKTGLKNPRRGTRV